MKRVYYQDNQPIGAVIKQLYAINNGSNQDALEQATMYILHKAGLAEDGVPMVQFEAAYNAFALVINRILDEEKKLLAK